MLEMQNSKCKVQNCEVSFGSDFIIIGDADTIILHFAFYILHSAFGQLMLPDKHQFSIPLVKWRGLG